MQLKAIAIIALRLLIRRRVELGVVSPRELSQGITSLTYLYAYAVGYSFYRNIKVQL